MSNYGYEELSAFPTQSVHHCIPLSQAGKQIRVLDLHPVHSRNPATAPALHGSLRVLSVPTDQEYSALSYVWSQEDPGTSQRENRLILHCDDHQHEARLAPNCWSALWHIRKMAEPSAIWVDAMCIDQRNDKEKSRQIPLMRKIYMSVRVTYFWLGEAGKHTDKAMDFLSTSPLVTGASGFSGVVSATAIILLRVLTFQLCPHQAGLADIFSRPWIRRLWTLQECLLAHNGILICGKKSISFLDFACALQSLHFFHINPWSVYFDDSHLPWLNLANLVRWWVAEDPENAWGLEQGLKWDLENLKRHDRKAEDQRRTLISAQKAFFYSQWIYDTISVWSVVILSAILPWRAYPRLHAILVLGWLPAWYTSRKSTSRELTQSYTEGPNLIVEGLRKRKAKNPEDMYYGMMGILGDDSPKEEGSSSIEVLYRKLCTSLIRKTRSLDILLLANAHTNNDLPSWVIDWRAPIPQVWDKALHFVVKVKNKQFLARDISDTTPITKTGTLPKPCIGSHY